MFSTKAKILIIAFFIMLVACLLFGGMWWHTSNKLEIAEINIANKNAIIESLRLDNDKLLDYTNRKNEEIKELEAKYKEKLKNIPKDKCGDQKPSKELLEYLRSAR